MDRWEGKVAVVTGASAGIGAAISKTLVEKGLKVVGLARRIERIQELSSTLNEAPGQLLGLRCDITNEESILKCFGWILENIGPVHILVNNASLIKPGPISTGSCDDWRKIFDVNVMALCVCSKEAIRIMRENSIAGHIINMNSLMGHKISYLSKEQNLNVYPASKFAVTGLTESLRQELRGLKSDIKVTSISPGLVRSEDGDGSQSPALRPEDVAEAVVYVLSTAPHVQVHEIMIHPLGDKH